MLDNFGWCGCWLFMLVVYYLVVYRSWFGSLELRIWVCMKFRMMVGISVI